jgi:hypothetical protein
MLDQVYQEQMRCHPYGIALYNPLSTAIFSPGAVGYFDNANDWNPIAHLSLPDTLDKAHLSPVTEELQRAPLDDTISWGPKCSQGVAGLKLNISAS